MARSTKHSKPAVQIVLQGEACGLGHHLDRNRIAYERLDQPGPMTMRVAATDWLPIREIATALGYARPDFFSQSDAVGQDPFKGFWLLQMAAERQQEAPGSPDGEARL